MAITELKKHDVVQVLPSVEMWGGSLVTVTEVSTWGIKGYIYIPGKGHTYILLNASEFEKIGTAIFVNQEDI